MSALCAILKCPLLPTISLIIGSGCLPASGSVGANRPPIGYGSPSKESFDHGRSEIGKSGRTRRIAHASDHAAAAMLASRGSVWGPASGLDFHSPVNSGLISIIKLWTSPIKFPHDEDTVQRASYISIVPSVSANRKASGSLSETTSSILVPRMFCRGTGKLISFNISVTSSGESARWRWARLTSSANAAALAAALAADVATLSTRSLSLRAFARAFLSALTFEYARDAPDSTTSTATNWSAFATVSNAAARALSPDRWDRIFRHVQVAPIRATAAPAIVTLIATKLSDSISSPFNILRAPHDDPHEDEDAGIFIDKIMIAAGIGCVLGGIISVLIVMFEAEPIGPGRYSPPKVTGTEKTPVFGFPIEELVSTSYVERQNLTMRMGVRRFTRLTNAHSKKFENHRAAVALHFTH